MSNKALNGLLSNVKLKTVSHSMMLFLGVIFIGIQFYTVTNYSSFINESNRKLKSNVVKTLVRERLIHHHYMEALNIAENIISDPFFQNSIITEDYRKIIRYLNEASAIKMSDLGILEISALSMDYKTLASWQPDVNKSLSLQKTPDEGTLRIRSHFYKSDDGIPLHMLILPIDEAKSRGFLVLITSPLNSLNSIREFIKTEAEVYDFADTTLIAGKQDGALNQNQENLTTLEIPISITDGEPFLNMVVYYDNKDVVDQQSRLNTFSILAVISGLLISAYIVSHILNISIISRIREVSEALVKILQGKPGVILPNERDDELSVLWEQLEKIAEHEEDRNRLSYELVFALKEAESSNLAKSEFLTNMSHELRTPLNAIIGFSEIMTSEYLASDLNDRYREYAQDIRDSGLHLLNIINNLLDLSTIETGEVALVCEEVDVCDIIVKSVNKISTSANEKSILIENIIPENIPTLFVDKRMVRQVLNSILSNAVKFTLDGGNVIINAGIVEDGAFCIAISDNGIGIEDNKIGKVSSSFCQANDSYTREYEGVGLGLTLVKAFMELHGGRMYLESIWGVGTSVFLIFPDDCLIQEKGKQLNAPDNEPLMMRQPK